MPEQLGRFGSRACRSLTAFVAATLALALLARPAAADVIDDIAKKLINYDGEVEQIRRGIRRPKIDEGSTDKAARRLIDAQVAFGMGNYDDAAVMLYDFVAKYPHNRSYDEALYYLAESLFLKGDSMASRTYFMKLIDEAGAKSKFYQQGLERLIELSLTLHDDTKVQEWLDALDKVPESKQRSSVPYVRGKHAYFSEQYNDAIGFFKKIGSKSKYYFQAQYFIGSCYVARRDLLAAVKKFSKVTRLKPNNDDDRLIIELAHMAMGRLYYECATAAECGVDLSAEEKANISKKYEKAELSPEQLDEKEQEARQQKLWAKAIDEYLMVSRHSKYFDEALYEIAWVYVKNKQFDKALRAVELLALSDPDASKLPDVKILEGNLRLRKAKRLAYSNEGNSAEEYEKARKVFEKTSDTFKEPYHELKRVIAEGTDPRQFMAQITGRVAEAFQVKTSLPEVAAEWVRKQPDIERVISIESDLGQVSDEIVEAERTIERLDQALTTSAGVNVFPTLAEKRTRSTEILEDLESIRISLADRLRELVIGSANAAERARLDDLTANRKRMLEDFHNLPDTDVAYGERIQRARNEYTELDKRTSEVAVVIDATEATLAALIKYLADQQVKPEEVASFEKTIQELRAEVKGMRAELASIRNEATLAKDAAGTGDEVALRANRIRDLLRQALADEQNYMQGLIGRLSGSKRTKADQIVSLVTRANSVALKLDEVNATIDEVVDMVLADVRASVEEEKARLSAYKREYNEYEQESQSLGGDVLGASFLDVQNQFKEVLVRSDVGIIDISWAQREFAAETAKRLNLDKKRAMRTLAADFREVLNEQKAIDKKRRQEEEKKKKAQEQPPDTAPAPGEGELP